MRRGEGETTRMDLRMNKCVRAYDWLNFKQYSSCRPLFHVQVADIPHLSITLTRYRLRARGRGKINIYLSSYSPALAPLAEK